MTTTFQKIRQAMFQKEPSEIKPTWAEIMGEMWLIIDKPLSPQEEFFLISLLRYTGKVQLDESAELPHSLSPENMLKSLAVQALGRWTGLTYISEMLRLALTSPNSRIKSTVAAVIKLAQDSHKTFTNPEVLKEIEALPTEPKKVRVDFPSKQLKPRPNRPDQRILVQPITRVGRLPLIAGQLNVKRRPRHKHVDESRVGMFSQQGVR